VDTTGGHTSSDASGSTFEQLPDGGCVRPCDQPGEVFRDRSELGGTGTGFQPHLKPPRQIAALAEAEGAEHARQLVGRGKCCAHLLGIRCVAPQRFNGVLDRREAIVDLRSGPPPDAGEFGMDPFAFLHCCRV
jgi:hypothetical protein